MQKLNRRSLNVVVEIKIASKNLLQCKRWAVRVYKKDWCPNTGGTKKNYKKRSFFAFNCIKSTWTE